MAKGLYLSLMIGPAVPVPVGQTVIDALTSVQVTVTAGARSQSGFQLAFNLGKNSPLEILFLLAGGAMPPLLRVILTATVNGTPEVLIDGVVTRTDIKPGESGGPSTLTVTGVDLTAVMDWIDFDGFPFPAMPPEARVAIMIAKYAMFGIIPLVIPSVLIDIPIPIKEIPRQQGTDYQYINQLAEDVGYVFYLKPGPAPGTSFAYWGPEIKVGAPQPALNVDMDAFTNVESLSFNFDAEHAELPVLLIYNQETKVPIPIPVPAITSLNPPLGLIPPIPMGLQPVSDDLSKRSLPQSIMIGLAKAAQWAEAVTAKGELDVLRYGTVLKPRKLVGVRGAGMAFDGLYYVKSVTHTIKRNDYTQSFELTRNGLVSTVAKVPA